MKITKSNIMLISIVLLAGTLRLYKLDQIPPSPYWEEAAIGFDAYSILKTGKDHHGNPWPLIAFESFGDYKPGLYFYAVVPFIALFGLNVLAVRLPSALAGTLTVWITFLLVKEMFPKQKKLFTTRTANFLALISALFMAISPWHLLVSRVGFETNLGLFLLALAIWMFFKGITFARRKSHSINYWWIFDGVIAGLSMYTYHANRVIVPLLGIVLGIIYIKDLLRNKTYLIIAVGMVTLFLLPIGLKISEPEIKQRFQETSAFATLDPILESNAAIARDGGGVIAQTLHHRWWYYLEIFLTNYASHFDPEFLFLTGDSNPRHSTQQSGQLFWIQGPLIVLGIFFIFYNQAWQLVVLLIWFMLAPVAAGITKAVPHALRALSSVVPLCVLSAYGLFGVWQTLSKLHKKIGIAIVFFSLVGIVLLLEFSKFWHYYFRFYPQKYSQEWQYGYEEVINYINDHKAEYDQIFFTREYGRPAMYYWFYSQTDPKLVQSLNEIVAKDSGEYLQFENLYFGSYPEATGRQLRVESKRLESDEYKLIKEITLLNGDSIFWIYEQ